MLKTLKRKIALVAVAALGSAGLAVVAAPSAFADAATLQWETGSHVITRTGAAGTAGTLVLEASANLTNADNEAITMTLKRNGVTLGTVPAGIVINWDDTNTQKLVGGGGEADNNAFGLFFDVATLAANADLASIGVATTTAPGKYDLSITTGTAYTDAATLTFYVSGAPASFAWTDTTKTVDAGGTATHTLSVLDSASNPTYFLAGEVADLSLVTVTGATMPTIDVAVLDSGTRPRTSLATTVTVSAGAGVTAGTYTLRAVASVGITAATATTLVVASAAPKAATTLTITDATYLNSDGDGDAAFDGTNDNVSIAANALGYISTAAKTFTFKAATASTSGSIRFTVAAAAGSLGLPAGISASTATDVAITGNATDGYSASLTLTALAPAPGFGFQVNTAAAGGTSRGFRLVYQSPSAFKVTTVDPLLDGGTISVVKGTKNSMLVAVTDQFGVALPNTGVIFTTAGRNATNGGAVTNASGQATYEWTDTSTSTTALTDTVTATVATANPAAGKTGHDGTASTTINYVDSVAVGTVTLSGTTDAVTGDADLDYETAIAADGTSALTIKTNDTALNGGAAATSPTDQARIKAVVKSAAGTAIQGVKVTFTASAGTFFATSANVTATLIPTVTSAKTTLDVYTDAAGEAYAQIRATKAGTVSVSATAGGVKETAPVVATVSNATADARSIATENVSGNAGVGTLVKFTVKDGFGNPVAGVGISFSVTGNGTFLNGTNTTTGITDTTGVASVSFIGSAAGTATVVGQVTQNPSQAFSEAAAVTSLGFAKAVKSATSTVTVGGAAPAAANPEITAVKTDVSSVKADVKAVSDTVATLSKAVTTVQSSVTELTSSFATQIKSLTDAIAKISRAIAAIQKSLKKK